MVYMQASIKLHPGKLPDFIALLNKVTPLAAKHGIKLVGSYASIVGRLNSVVDLWELPEPNSVEKLLSDPELQKFGPQIAEIYLKNDPAYTGRVTVPVLWDKRGARIVNNESAERSTTSQHGCHASVISPAPA